MNARQISSFLATIIKLQLCLQLHRNTSQWNTQHKHPEREPTYWNAKALNAPDNSGSILIQGHLWEVLMGLPPPAWKFTLQKVH